MVDSAASKTIYYTLEQANEMIPELQETLLRLKLIQMQVKSYYAQIQSLNVLHQDDLDILLMQDDLELEDIDDLTSLKVLLMEMRSKLDTLEAKGCKVINLAKGIVNWRAKTTHDKDATLTWRWGESAVAVTSQDVGLDHIA